MDIFKGDLKPQNDIYNKEDDEDNMYCLDNVKDYIIPYYYLTPSEFYCKMEQNEEKALRCFFANVIIEGGVILKMRQRNVLTSIKLFQYFHWKIYFNKYNPLITICACMLLGNKVEETKPNANDIINTILYIFNDRKGTQEIIQVDYFYEEWFKELKNDVYLMELIIMKELGYNLTPFSDHPHKYLLHFLKKIKNDLDLLNKSWGYLNDMYKTSLVVNYPTHALTCGSIFFASRMHFISITEEIPWWEIFDTKYSDIEEICAEMLRLYKDIEIKTFWDIHSIWRKHSKIKNIEKDKSKSKSKNSNDSQQKRNHHYSKRRYSHEHHKHKHKHRERSRKRSSSSNSYHRRSRERRERRKYK